MHDNIQMRDFNREQYLRFWQDLNRELRSIQNKDGLSAALEALRAQQRDQGFIRDDLESVERYEFRHPDAAARFFSVQYNPVRLQRFKGLGRTQPPPGVSPLYNGCFLCHDNIRWQQSGIEVGYDIKVASTAYIVWMNAYPLMPIHAVIATKDHIPQAWATNPDPADQFAIEHIIEDLVALSNELPGYIGFYNGEGAGASIPGHLHYQFFKRPRTEMHFPLEMAPRTEIEGALSLVEDYPVMAVCCRGSAEAVVRCMAAWARDWVARTQLASPSANIFSMVDAATRQTELYISPRDQMRSHSLEMSGLIGGLEVLGELVFSSDDEKQRLDRGEVDYHAVERILASVRVGLD
ncbi:MAG: DUF4922 domain-containing protein [Gammaproteobacteria bacterium]